MNAKSRRKIEMGARVLKWSREHPDPSPGYAAALSRLENRLALADQLAAVQRDGILEVRRASARKRELQRQIKQAHIPHLTKVAKIASAEEPELSEKFVMPGRVTTYAAFRTAARGLAAEAETRKELLVKHGLSEAVLEDLNRLLDEFDAVVEQGGQGRAAHVGASIELDNVANEVVQVVNVMDGLNHFRFGRDGQLLGAWESVSNVAATPRPEITPDSEGTIPSSGPTQAGGTSALGGELKPAA